jgi:hypothetical protein
MTRWVLGIARWISATRVIASTSRVGLGENLQAPWDVPIAMASDSILLSCLARLQGSQAAELALDRSRRAECHAVLSSRCEGSTAMRDPRQ